MTDLPTLKSLLERVEKATGPSRELDAAIAAALDVRPVWLLGAFGALWSKGECLYWRHEGMKRGTGNPSVEFESYTASLDAALALVKEMLPGWTRAVDATAPECGIDVELFAPDDKVRTPHRTKATHDLETHATLLALLRALQSQQKNSEVKDAG